MSIDPIKILLVEDEQGDPAPLGTLLAQIVRTIPFVITHSQTLPVALKQLQTNSFDILLLDLTLLGDRGLVAFKQFNAQANSVPIVLLSGFDDANLALEAVRQGAQDYLVKSQLDSRLLVRSIRYAIERHRLRADLQNVQWQKQQDRELLLLEQLTTAQTTVIASKLYDNLPLRNSVPQEFQQLVQQYGHLLDLALEQRTYRVNHPVSEGLRSIAEQLGFLKASPRDTIELHTQAIKQKIADVPSAKAQAYIEEARILVLELMGFLVSYYRKYHLALSYVKQRSNGSSVN